MILRLSNPKEEKRQLKSPAQAQAVDLALNCMLFTPIAILNDFAVFCRS
jgi:hypothetical protein